MFTKANFSELEKLNSDFVNNLLRLDKSVDALREEKGTTAEYQALTNAINSEEKQAGGDFVASLKFTTGLIRNSIKSLIQCEAKFNSKELSFDDQLDKLSKESDKKAILSAELPRELDNLENYLNKLIGSDIYSSEEKTNCQNLLNSLEVLKSETLRLKEKLLPHSGTNNNTYTR